MLKNKFIIYKILGIICFIIIVNFFLYPIIQNSVIANKNSKIANLLEISKTDLIVSYKSCPGWKLTLPFKEKCFKTNLYNFRGDIIQFEKNMEDAIFLNVEKKLTKADNMLINLIALTNLTLTINNISVENLTDYLQFRYTSPEGYKFILKKDKLTVGYYDFSANSNTYLINNRIHTKSIISITSEY